MKSQIKAGILISYGTLLLNNIVPLIYTPIMLRLLGQAEYGVYGVSQSIMNYMYLLNIGLGGTIVRYLSKYRASGEREKEEQVAGMFFQIYCIIALVILAIGVIVSVNIQYYDNAMSTEELKTLQRLVFLSTINMAFFLPLNVMGSILVAHEEFIVNKGVALITTIVTPFFNLLFLFLGTGSIGFIFTNILTNAFGYIIYTAYAFRIIGIHPHFAKPDWPLLREIFQFTAFVFLGRLVDAMFWSTDSVIIGWSIGSTAVAVYQIGMVFRGHVASFASAISNIFIPKLTAMDTEHMPDAVFSEFFIRIGRIQFIIVSFIISAFVAFGRQFILLWAGPGYEEAYYVAIFTMIPGMIGIIQTSGVDILYARNKHRFRAIVYFVIALLNIGLTSVWVKDYGIIGATAATCFSLVLGDGLFLNWYYWKKLHLDISLFWKTIIEMSPLMFVLGYASYMVIEHCPFTNWIAFFAYAIIFTVSYGCLAYVFMMNQYERELLKKPLRRIKNAIVRNKVVR